MEQNNQVATTAPGSKVALSLSLIEAQPNAKAILELAAIRDNWVGTYTRISGKGEADAGLRFEAEKILFLQAISGSNLLQKADKFSIYTSFFELAISGGTLRDGMCYIVPFKGKAQYLPGWKFRLEQINELPDVTYCHEPVVVYDCDTFDYEMGEKPRIHKHKPGTRTKDSKPTHVYFVIDFSHGTGVYVMDAVKVYAIRDQYSQSYKEYVKACAAAKQDPALGKPVSKTYNGNTYEVELPMWVKDESQAFQKTIVKQTWKHLPKLPKHKWLEDRLKAAQAQDVDPDDVKGNEAAGGAGKPPENAGDYDNMMLKDTRPQVQQQQGADYTEYEDVNDNGGGAPGQQQPQGAEDLKSLAADPNEGF